MAYRGISGIERRLGLAEVVAFLLPEPHTMQIQSKHTLRLPIPSRTSFSTRPNTMSLRRASQPSIVKPDGSAYAPTYDRDPAQQAAEGELEPYDAHASRLVEWLGIRLANNPRGKLSESKVAALVRELTSQSDEEKTSIQEIAERNRVSHATVYGLRTRLRLLLPDAFESLGTSRTWRDLLTRRTGNP